jgi:hypothetical protein
MEQQFDYQSQPVRSDEIYANIMQEDRIKNVIAQTSPDNQLIEISWRLKGRVRDSNGQWVRIDEDSKELNPTLVSRYVSFLSSIMQDSGRFTNLSETQINNMMSNIIDYLADDLDDNAEEYGLDGQYTERSRIGMMILYNTFFVLNRSLNGTEARRIWSMMSVNEVTNTNPNQPKNMLDKLKFWK